MKDKELKKAVAYLLSLRVKELEEKFDNVWWFKQQQKIRKECTEIVELIKKLESWQV